MKKKARAFTESDGKAISFAILRKQRSKRKPDKAGENIAETNSMPESARESTGVNVTAGITDNKTLRHFSRNAGANGLTTPEGAPESADFTRISDTLLLAEDDELVRSLISLILRHEGYRVIEAVDGKQAIEKYINHMSEIDALVLDVILPKKNGKEVFDLIRKMNPDIRTLFISGYATETIEKKGVEDSFQVITKPFTPAAFLESVRKVLD